MNLLLVELLSSFGSCSSTFLLLRGRRVQLLLGGLLSLVSLSAFEALYNLEQLIHLKNTCFHLNSQSPLLELARGKQKLQEQTLALWYPPFLLFILGFAGRIELADQAQLTSSIDLTFVAVAKSRYQACLLRFMRSF
jgi:hypothetical protein